MKVIDFDGIKMPTYDRDGRHLLNTIKKTARVLNLSSYDSTIGFLLDNHYSVQTSIQATNILGYDASYMKGKPLSTFLWESDYWKAESKTTWSGIMLYLATSNNLHVTAKLSFITTAPSIFPTYSYITKIPDGRIRIIAVGSLLTDHDRQEKLKQDYKKRDTIKQLNKL